MNRQTQYGKRNLTNRTIQELIALHQKNFDLVLMLMEQLKAQSPHDKPQQGKTNYQSILKKLKLKNRMCVAIDEVFTDKRLNQ